MYNEFDFDLYDNLWKDSTSLLKEEAKIGLFIKTFCLNQLHDNQRKLNTLTKKRYVDMIYEMKNLKSQFNNIDTDCNLRDYENFLKKNITFLEYQHMKGNKTQELADMYMNLMRSYEPLKHFNAFTENYKKLLTEDINKVRSTRSVSDVNSLLSRKNSIESSRDRLNSNPLPPSSNESKSNNENPFKQGRINRVKSDKTKNKKINELENNYLKQCNLPPTQRDFKLHLDTSKNNIERIPFVLKRHDSLKDIELNNFDTPNGRPRYHHSPKKEICMNPTGSITFSGISTDTSSFNQMHSKAPSFSTQASNQKMDSFSIGEASILPKLSVELQAVKTKNLNAIKQIENGFITISIQLLQNSINSLRALKK